MHDNHCVGSCYDSKEHKIWHQEQNKDQFYNIFVINFEWHSKVRSKTHQSHWVEDGDAQYLLISHRKWRNRTPLAITTFLRLCGHSDRHQDFHTQEPSKEQIQIQFWNLSLEHINQNCGQLEFWLGMALLEFILFSLEMNCTKFIQSYSQEWTGKPTWSFTGLS